MNAVFTPDDFSPAKVQQNAQQLSRPSLSYWQDAWLRLKKNTRAIVSLYLVIGLMVFTLLGPIMWSVNPAQQNLDQISLTPALGRQALIVTPYQQWLPVKATSVVEGLASSDEYVALPGVEQLQQVLLATTQRVRLQWQPVTGAQGYNIYRNEHRPQDSDDLGLPLGQTDAANLVSYEDRLNLKSDTYYYSVVAHDGIDESDNYAFIPVDVSQAITLTQARERGLVGNGSGKVGDYIALEIHPLGTDYLGRDMLARLMEGARVSLFIGIVAPFIFVLMGVIYGGVAGYVGGKVDAVLMRFADFVVALPFLLFMILFRLAFGVESGDSGIMPMLVALIILGWPATARLVRGQVLQIREEAYVQAAQLLGAKPGYLIMRHMIPNALGVILVTLTFAVPSAIFTEAFLSFIGMGVSPPTPSWGSMSQEGIKSMVDHPHELIFPALIISVTVLIFNLLGDGLRDALDAKMRSAE